MTKLFRDCVVVLALVGAGCSQSAEKQNGDTLQSDIPLRSAQYLFDHPDEAAELKLVCDQWKASQRPVQSWPSVVAENCNNENSARFRRIQRSQREDMRKQMGI